MPQMFAIYLVKFTAIRFSVVADHVVATGRLGGSFSPSIMPSYGQPYLTLGTFAVQDTICCAGACLACLAGVVDINIMAMLFLLSGTPFGKRGFVELQR